MSTSYFMNIGAYVATVIFAAARLAVGGVLTEPGALVPALLVLGILLIPLASKGGFQKSTYQTGPAFGLAWGVLYAFLTPVVLAAVSSGWSDLCSRVGKLTHLGWPMVAGAVLLAALTLEKGAQKQSIYRAARLLVWAAYILLLNWRAGAMRLDADDCWLISVLGVPVAGAVYELLEQKGQVTAKWYHAPLALLALLTVSMAALQDMRFILLLVGLGVLWWICARLGTLAGKVQGGDAGLLGRCGYAASGGFAAAGHPGSDPGQLACCAGASGRFLVCADGIPIRAIQGGKRNGDLPGGVQHGLQALQCGAAAGCGACCAVRGILT